MVQPLTEQKLRAPTGVSTNSILDMVVDVQREGARVMARDPLPPQTSDFGIASLPTADLIV